MVLNVHRNHKAYQGRGEGGGRGYSFDASLIVLIVSVHAKQQSDLNLKLFVVET